MSSELSTNDSLGDCVICLEPTHKRGGAPLICPACCGNWFHISCLKESIRVNNTCPICRELIPNHLLSAMGSVYNPFRNLPAPQPHRNRAATAGARYLGRRSHALGDARDNIWPTALQEDAPLYPVNDYAHPHHTLTITPIPER